MTLQATRLICNLFAVVFGARRRRGKEEKLLAALLVALLEGAVGHEAMEVDVKAKVAAEALDHPPVSAKLSPPPTTNKRGENHQPDMCKPITQDPSIASTDEFDISLENLISAERPANTRPAQEVVLLIPDGVAYTFDRHSHPGALRLRIFVGVAL